MNLNEIKQAVATAAMAGTVGQYKITATPFWPGSPSIPCLAPAEFDGDYHADMDGSVDLTMTWRLAVGRQEEEAGQLLLDTYLSTGADNSVVDAIEGNTVHDFTVTDVSAYRLFEWAGNVYYGAELTVEVLA
jgi:hypothetical protein